MKKNAGKVTREPGGFRVRFERILNHDIRTVWDAITNPEKLRIWFTDFEMEFRPGGKITIYFRDQGRTATHGKVISITPPHRFEFTWEGEHGLWELSEMGKDKCKLVLTYSKLGEEYAVGAPAGFHTLLDRLEKMLAGSNETYPFGTEEFDPAQQALQDEYGEIIYNDFPELLRLKPIVIERILDAPIDRLWRALTDPEEMKQWYFDIPGFKAEVGHEFKFLAGDDQQKWLHVCKVTAVRPASFLSYSWRYDGYEGESQVRFQLTPHNGKTLLRLTHSGLHTLPASMEAFRKENFQNGWTQITAQLAAHVKQTPVPAASKA
ncbi:MAG TPA: SRPBCC domain-containing protein [Chryseosolibacter sp.]|nr:SRPBCC domain-containing protein [Chryseosolibacter sp.]